MLRLHLGSHSLELAATIGHAGEEVEAGAAGAEQHGVAFVCQLAAGRNALGHAVCAACG